MKIKLNRPRIDKEPKKMTTIDPRDEERFTRYLVIVVGVLSFLLAFCIGVLFLSGCTLSFQNISTNGKASDLVSENQTAEPDIKTDLSIPAKAL